MRRRFFKQGVKALSSTQEWRFELKDLSTKEERGIPSVGVKSIDIRKNTKGEGDFLVRN